MVGRVGLLPKISLATILALALVAPVLFNQPLALNAAEGGSSDGSGGSSSGTDAAGPGLGAATVDDAAILSGHVPVLRTYGGHSYWVARLGHPAETALSSGPDGKVWLADDRRLQFTTNGGQTWTGRNLTPGNAVLLVVPEGDIAVAPNGDVFTTWLSPSYPHNNEMYRSTDGGASFLVTPLVGPQGVPDRPWVTAGAAIDGDPNKYIAVTEAGTGLKPIWASNDRGLTWFLPTNKLPSSVMEERPFPALPDNAFMDYVKPLGQGMRSKYVALPGGEWLEISTKFWTEDFVTWFRFPNSGLFGSSFPYWDVSSDGTIYVSNFVSNATGWFIRWKYYDETGWHNGAFDIPLAAQPDYPFGLNAANPNLPASHEELMAIKSRGSLLGINTREGLQDVLIRIQGANTATPTYTKESIGPPGDINTRYDFPNLVFDNLGRAVMSHNSAFVAYATAV